MDRTLSDALARFEKPFDGVTLHATGPLSTGELVALLRGALKSIDQPGLGPLRIFQDWSLHDGWISESESITVAELAKRCADEYKLMRSLSDDTHVKTALYPEDRRWLMRWGLADGSPASGSFDLTASKEVLDTFSLPGFPSARTDAGIFFEAGIPWTFEFGDS